VAPDVYLRKLTYLRQLLADLEPYRQATLAEVEAEHYKLERLIELLVMTASDLLRHLLAGRGFTPVTYRDTFYQAGEQGIIPTDLAERLQKAAGMRNILVHLYERIDLEILHTSLAPAYEDFTRFVEVLESGED